MDGIELLTTRASNGKLTEPAPDSTSLQLAFEAATHAPDHACLRPWRVRLVRGTAREQLGELMAAVVLRQNPAASAEQLEQVKAKALRAPLILVVGAVLKPHAKVPEIEQILAAGAAAHAILLTLHARGYAGIWRTGAAAYDTAVKRALGFAASDAIVGFIYAGTAKQPAPNIARAVAEDLVSEWTGATPEI
jgi:nitroreductase